MRTGQDWTIRFDDSIEARNKLFEKILDFCSEYYMFTEAMAEEFDNVWGIRYLMSDIIGSVLKIEVEWKK